MWTYLELFFFTIKTHYLETPSCIHRLIGRSLSMKESSRGDVITDKDKGQNVQNMSKVTVLQKIQNGSSKKKDGKFMVHQEIESDSS